MIKFMERLKVTTINLATDRLCKISPSTGVMTHNSTAQHNITQGSTGLTNASRRTNNYMLLSLVFSKLGKHNPRQSEESCVINCNQC